MCDKFFVIVFLTYISIAASSLVPFIDKCKHDDLKCLKTSSQKAVPILAAGLPELKVGKLDPLVIKHVDASSPNLKMTITDITVTGLKDCKAQKVVRDIKAPKLIVKLLCSPDFVGQYEMKGQLFVLPIEGKGALTAKVRDIEITAHVNYVDKVGKDGKTHWSIKSWSHSFELKDKSDVKFANLFPENEFLRKSTEDLIASNGNDVITEIGQPVIKAVVADVVDEMKHFFDTVPLEDLIID